MSELKIALNSLFHTFSVSGWLTTPPVDARRGVFQKYFISDSHRKFDVTHFLCRMPYWDASEMVVIKYLLLHPKHVRKWAVTLLKLRHKELTQEWHSGKIGTRGVPSEVRGSNHGRIHSSHFDRVGFLWLRFPPTFHYKSPDIDYGTNNVPSWSSALDSKFIQEMCGEFLTTNRKWWGFPTKLSLLPEFLKFLSILQENVKEEYNFYLV
jgi:hypothetical protein